MYLVMVLVLDGKQEIGAQVSKYLCDIDLTKAFDYFESSHKSGFFFSEKTHCPSCLRNMF